MNLALRLGIIRTFDLVPSFVGVCISSFSDDVEEEEESSLAMLIASFGLSCIKIQCFCTIVGKRQFFVLLPG